MLSKHLVRVSFVLVLAAAALHADARGTKQDAAALRQKVVSITQFAARPAPSPRRTTVTEKEVNAYLAYDATPDLPPGVVDPAITIVGAGRLSGRAVVDLDAVREHSKPTSMLDPTAYLMGRVPITVAGTLTTSGGTGRFALESATIAGVPVPKTVLQTVVSYYTRSPELPNGLNLDDPFALPARIREIRVQQGQAVIVQ
jgi:hypothetical protein